MSPLVGILVVERERPTLADLPSSALAWAQVVGGLATLGLLLGWISTRMTSRNRQEAANTPAPLRSPFALQGSWYEVMLAVALACYAAAAIMFLIQTEAGAGEFFITFGGIVGLVGAGVPFVLDLARLSPRRIWAIARLSIQEAIRHKVLWAYVVLLLVFLFASWFVPHKPEDQVRTYVHVMFAAMAPLLLVTAAMLAAFSIATDIQNQTIHTILTKPVERFEIVLGRFLGLVLLLSGVLGVLALLGLGYVWREIDPEAAFATLRARVPRYGELHFQQVGPGQVTRGVLRREWRYRTFLTGGRDSPHRAVWSFRELPADFAGRAVVPCEFEFDVTRSSTRTVEDEGVGCTLSFRSWRWDPARQDEYQRERDRQRLDPVVLDQLAEKFGIYEDSRLVVNKRTFSIAVPGGLFRNALSTQAGGGREPPEGGATPLIEVVVKCEDESAYLGLARHDLYLLESEGWFGLNFLKGAMGLWFRLCLVVGVALACSTYLSGVVSWLVAMFLYGTGLFLEFIRDMAQGTLLPGTSQRKVSGPGESLVAIFSPQPESTPAADVAGALDEAFRWFLRRFLNLIPDVDLFDWTEHVAEGFDIAVSDLGLNLLLLAAYLVPWFVLAYYLMRSREVAA